MADYQRVNYQRVYTTVWDQPWDEDTRYLAFYLMTCKHRVTEGLFRLPKPYAWADLRWAPERFERAFSTLLADGFAEYDPAAEVLLLPKALELQQPGNTNQIVGATRALERLPDSFLFQRFYEIAKTFAKAFAKALAKAFPERLAEGFGNSHSSQLTSLIDEGTRGTRPTQPTGPVDNSGVEQPNLSVVDGRGGVA